MSDLMSATSVLPNLQKSTFCLLTSKKCIPLIETLNVTSAVNSSKLNLVFSFIPKECMKRIKSLSVKSVQLHFQLKVSLRDTIKQFICQFVQLSKIQLLPMKLSTIQLSIIQMSKNQLYLIKLSQIQPSPI